MLLMVCMVFSFAAAAPTYAVWMRFGLVTQRLVILGFAALFEFGRAERIFIGAAAAGPLVSLDLAAPGAAEMALAFLAVEVRKLFAFGQPEDVRVSDLGSALGYSAVGMLLAVFFGMMTCT
jgi:hypothetical protein